jgi:hypothetical protein
MDEISELYAVNANSGTEQLSVESALAYR